MPDPERVLAVAREWMVKADNAARVIRSGAGWPADTVCFHAQQCVEKCLKALLVFRGIPFPKTHNIRDLLRWGPSGIRPHVEAGEQDRLTEYATVTRYPGEYEPVPPPRPARPLPLPVAFAVPRAGVSRRPRSDARRGMAARHEARRGADVPAQTTISREAAKNDSSGVAVGIAIGIADNHADTDSDTDPDTEGATRERQVTKIASSLRSSQGRWGMLRAMTVGGTPRNDGRWTA
jgi:HEPN domain-containing protein